MLASALNVEIPNKKEAHRAIAGAMLKRERTMSERMDAIEEEMDVVKRRLSALEGKKRISS